jgi:hypothetical protein
MLRLCLTSSAEAPDRFRVELALEGEGLPRQTANTTVELAPSPQDEEGLRWYLEEYLQWPRDRAPEIAARIEQRLAKSAGKPHDAAETRFNVAFDLAQDGRLQDALGYARSALRGFEACGPAAAPDFEQTRQLMEQIQTTMAESG